MPGWRSRAAATQTRQARRSGRRTTVRGARPWCSAPTRTWRTRRTTTSGCSGRHRPAREVRRIRRVRRLARMPVFATCPVRQLRRISRWGDVIAVQAGQVLVREDHSDWWFFVVVSGRGTLSRDGRATGELLPGAHFGDAALIGLRPQPSTATAAESSVLFVLGPRYVLSLLSSSAGFRSAVAPEVEPRQFAEFAERMHAEGESEWKALAQHNAALAAVGAPTRTKQAASVPQRDR